MKRILFLLIILLTIQQSYAQHIYQIRADSVRIYNVCDTAELIIENRTRGINGFLHNKGNGRTEFQRIQLESIGNGKIAIPGQDTLDLATLPGIRGIDTIYGVGDSIRYVKAGVVKGIYAPLAGTAGDYVSRVISTVHPLTGTMFEGDLNDVRNSSISLVGNGTNAPSSSAGMLFSGVAPSGGPAIYGFQLFGTMATSDGLYYRWFQGSGTTIWNQVASREYTEI